MKTITAQRADWLRAHLAEIERALAAPRGNSPRGGDNARTAPGWSGGGWGWWWRALVAAGIDCPCKGYWSGSAPTPSTAIPIALADYIYLSAPSDLLEISWRRGQGKR